MMLAALTLALALVSPACARTDDQPPPVDPSSVIHKEKASGTAPPNIIIIVADDLGYGDLGPWYQGSPGSFRGRKGQSYEGGHRVPFLASWPGRIAAGTVSHTPAINLDLFPT